MVEVAAEDGVGKYVKVEGGSRWKSRGCVEEEVCN